MTAMTTSYGAALAAMFGAILGSFLNVVAYRLPKGESLSARVALPRLRDADQAVRQRPRPLVAPAARPLPLVRDVDRLALSARRADDRGADGARRARFGASEEVWLGFAFVLLLVPVTVIDIDFRIIPNKLMIIGTVAAPAILALTDPARCPST